MFTSYFGRIALHGISLEIYLLNHRFKVKIEMSDCDSTTGFILFASYMSYLIEKSCAYFVAQTKAMSQIIDVGSDEIANDVDFMTPPAEVKNQ
ncbi:hypothetical protein QL285_055978 [Trifolium repens]|nr:hypothetical protein QL285_055978 [Trifolium repens]